MDYNYFDDNKRFDDRNEIPKLELNGRTNWLVKILIPSLLFTCIYLLNSGKLDGLIYDQIYLIFPTIIILVVIPALLFFTAKFWIKHAG